jgi:hypothetical protein
MKLILNLRVGGGKELIRPSGDTDITGACATGVGGTNDPFRDRLKDQMLLREEVMEILRYPIIDLRKEGSRRKEFCSGKSHHAESCLPEESAPRDG